ncbi:hypothetical protein SAMN04488034_1186 [Salinimicrobium catena]|uniref:DUF3575 domain-containing protein n=1 Tax=Salinimicrobium catena TaxID=390640 RepID=A0A1H5PH19_9FLAO|nr:hypothetical protein [Salinimicrobium catena]SDL85951.1 hypothetical protein SAMN04488140_1196 [Salinimicrobium catena]SEF13183.1 hypothetical protein SAMN04488034_1186 [Salinimicrobium catena]
MKINFFEVLFCCLLFAFAGKATGQEGFKISTGIGVPELLNLGLHIQLKNTQVSFLAGSFPWYEEENFGVSGNFYYHFGGTSKFTPTKPWYGKMGLSYLHLEDEWERNSDLVLAPRIGREINLSPKFGIAIEAGLMVLLISDEKVKKERPHSFWDLELDFSGDVLPSAGLYLFYRF